MLTINDVLRLSFVFFFSSRRRHTRFDCDWSSDVCSSDLIHGPGLDEAIAAPDHVEQLLTPEDPPGGADQGGQKLELLRRELDLPTLHPHLEAIAVDLQIAGLEARLLLLGVGRPTAPKNRADPGDQLAGRERLGHVIVGADLEAEDL